MADKKKKSQAERAASAASSRKSKSGRSASKGNSGKNSKDTAHGIPVRVITSIIFFILFVLFAVIAFKPEGTLMEALNDFIRGLIGKAGFYIAIPAFAYLFYLHAFCAKRPIAMRTTCVALFVLISGALAHLFINPNIASKGMGVISELWNTGITGNSGGVICGGLGLLLNSLLGSIISIFLLIICGILALLGSFQITFTSIIRAIQNRPRPEWEDEAQEEPQEPAAVVVNHLANKRIAYLEKQRQAQQNAAEGECVPQNATDIMRQIDSDVDDPVSAASHDMIRADEPEIIPVSDSANGIPSAEAIPTQVEPEVFDETEEVKITAKESAKKKVSAEDAGKSAAEVSIEIAQSEEKSQPEYCFPPINLLCPSNGTSGDGTMEMRDNTKRLNEALASFKIEAHIINVTRGPSVTRYEVELEKGVRLNKLTTAADDIALNLGATGVRIAAIPGKISVVGIEVPNRAVTMVSLREVIDSADFCNAKSKSSFAVGKDIGGNCIIGNIAKLPHMLIAGTTGSGKSVCMNSIIISLLYKATPSEVKLIMVDPKMVELGIYNGIPHLLIPVVTDPKKAAGSLQWAVMEMMRRYKSMSDAGVRDLESYNGIMESVGNMDAKLPQIVVIIDELADLMLVAAKEVEESICRIAQMGRAAGIHLIIATQRPSADVITGLMKANIPSRIAFAVASAMESRIILDTVGADKLVGKGDMLYAPIGDGKPRRVQGCFVTQDEVRDVVNYVKNNSLSQYDQRVIEEIDRKAAQSGNGKSTPTVSDPDASSDELAGDEMLPAAVDVILETGQASVSMLQRRLKLGYARAARIVDEMEERGLVGPFAGSKPREILITKEKWSEMQSGDKQLSVADISDSEEI